MGVLEVHKGSQKRHDLEDIVYVRAQHFRHLVLLLVVPLCLTLTLRKSDCFGLSLRGRFLHPSGTSKRPYDFVTSEHTDTTKFIVDPDQNKDNGLSFFQDCKFPSSLKFQEEAQLWESWKRHDDIRAETWPGCEAHFSAQTVQDMFRKYPEIVCHGKTRPRLNVFRLTSYPQTNYILVNTSGSNHFMARPTQPLVIDSFKQRMARAFLLLPEPSGWTWEYTGNVVQCGEECLRLKASANHLHDDEHCEALQAMFETIVVESKDTELVGDALALLDALQVNSDQQSLDDHIVECLEAWLLETQCVDIAAETLDILQRKYQREEYSHRERS